MTRVAAIERLRIPDDQGRTRYSLLKAFHERTGKKHPDLELPAVHASHAYLVAWFNELADTRHNGRPISFTEIEAWARLHGRQLAGWEVDAIRRMDEACLQVHAKARRDAAAAQPKGKK